MAISVTIMWIILYNSKENWNKYCLWCLIGLFFSFSFFGFKLSLPGSALLCRPGCRATPRPSTEADPKWTKLPHLHYGRRHLMNDKFLINCEFLNSLGCWELGKKTKKVFCFIFLCLCVLAFRHSLCF